MGRTVFVGGRIVDGTGAPAFEGDLVIEEDRIVEITAAGTAATEGATVEDVAGLVISPGFIDVHTHYDAQILWDPDVTPSTWHGVTTAVMGNCGFGIAPTRPEHRQTIILTLENVEGMSAVALEEGIDWTFESFPEFLDAVDGRDKRLNVAALVGHTPVRLYVLGEDASDRTASDDEVQQMASLVAEAVSAGAIGLGSSKGAVHNGAHGKPVPSRLAELGELYALGTAAGSAGARIIQCNVGPGLGVDECATLSERSGTPVCYTPLFANGDGSALAAMDRVPRLHGEVWGQFGCRPIVMQIVMADPYPFGAVEAFAEILSLPHDARAERYGEEPWRARARADYDAWEASGREPRLSRMLVAETALRSDLIGRAVPDLAAEWGTHPVDVMLDLSLPEDLQLRFTMILANHDVDEIGELLHTERAVVGLSDAGAHASQLCDAVFSTAMFEEWVRGRGVLTLEQAVHHLTAKPAQVFGLEGRGRLVEGGAADVVVFDEHQIGPLPQRRERDLPGGADRLVAGSRGIEQVWVNGVKVWSGGEALDVSHYPGRLLRGGIG